MPQGSSYKYFFWFQKSMIYWSLCYILSYHMVGKIALARQKVSRQIPSHIMSLRTLISKLPDEQPIVCVNLHGHVVVCHHCIFTFETPVRKSGVHIMPDGQYVEFWHMAVFSYDPRGELCCDMIRAPLIREPVSSVLSKHWRCGSQETRLQPSWRPPASSHNVGQYISQQCIIACICVYKGQQCNDLHFIHISSGRLILQGKGPYS